MTLVATAVALVARGRVRPAITAALTVSCVLAYSILVGLAPSVARAAVMAVVASLGLAFGRRAATDNALALAVATMVGIDASAIGDVGFLLSATATAGLLYLGDPLSRRLAFLPGAIRQGLATTLAATLPTIPIIAAVFGRVSLVSPLANLVAVPLFPPLMLAGAATAVLGAFSLDLGQLPGLLAYALAFLLRVVVETSAALPLASLAVPDGPLAGLGYGALVAIATAPRPGRDVSARARRRRSNEMASSSTGLGVRSTSSSRGQPCGRAVRSPSSSPQERGHGALAGGRGCARARAWTSGRATRTSSSSTAARSSSTAAPTRPGSWPSWGRACRRGNAGSTSSRSRTRMPITPTGSSECSSATRSGWRSNRSASTRAPSPRHGRTASRARTCRGAPFRRVCACASAMRRSRSSRPTAIRASTSRRWCCASSVARSRCCSWAMRPSRRRPIFCSAPDR